MSLAVHYTLPLFTKIGTLYPFLACKHADRKSYILKILEVLCPDYIMDLFRVVLGQAFRGLTGGFLLLRIFSFDIFCESSCLFILDLILISMFLR